MGRGLLSFSFFCLFLIPLPQGMNDNGREYQVEHGKITNKKQRAWRRQIRPLTIDLQLFNAFETPKPAMEEGTKMESKEVDSPSPAAMPSSVSDVALGKTKTTKGTKAPHRMHAGEGTSCHLSWQHGSKRITFTSFVLF